MLVYVSETQNITLGIPREVLRRVKRLAADRIREFAVWKVFATGANDVLRAIVTQQQAHISFWDAMAVYAAAELGCDVLWTEDLNDGQVIGGVRISNPFTSK